MIDLRRTDDYTTRGGSPTGMVADGMGVGAQQNMTAKLNWKQSIAGLGLSIRFQLLSTLLICSALPSFVRLQIGQATVITPNFTATFVGTASAIILGFYFHRQLTVFPGVRADFYIIPTYAATFLSVLVIFFFMRIDYTRTTFLASFGLTIVWLHFLSVVLRRAQPYALAVILEGDAKELLDISGVRWLVLRHMEMPKRSWNGLVADLHADLPDEWMRFISETAVAGIPVFHTTQVRESLTGKVEINHLSENTLGSLNPNQAYRELKHTLDWIGALVASVALLPLFLVLAVLIKLDSRGPVFFLQERRGYRGVIFKCIKFRTMVAAATSTDDNEARERARTKHGDARITRLGRILRRTRLDELPQIINILRGEMSWIGPRPEARVLADWYESELPFYSYRHIVHPGITGWAQVNQGHVSAVEDVLDKLHYDFYYIKNFSFWLDMLITVRTIRTVFTGFGSR